MANPRDTHPSYSFIASARRTVLRRDTKVSARGSRRSNPEVRPRLVTALQARIASGTQTHRFSRWRSNTVAFACDMCGKRHQSGHNVSHANNKTKRVFNPNLQTVRALVEGTPKRIRVCTRCLRSGKVKKSV